MRFGRLPRGGALVIWSGRSATSLAVKLRFPNQSDQSYLIPRIFLPVFFLFLFFVPYALFSRYSAKSAVLHAVQFASLTSFSYHIYWFRMTTHNMQTRASSRICLSQVSMPGFDVARRSQALPHGTIRVRVQLLMRAIVGSQRVAIQSPNGFVQASTVNTVACRRAGTQPLGRFTCDKTAIVGTIRRIDHGNYGT
jgi:hypothetical protein